MLRSRSLPNRDDESRLLTHHETSSLTSKKKPEESRSSIWRNPIRHLSHRRRRPSQRGDNASEQAPTNANKRIFLDRTKTKRDQNSQPERLEMAFTQDTASVSLPSVSSVNGAPHYNKVDVSHLPSMSVSSQQPVGEKQKKKDEKKKKSKRKKDIVVGMSHEVRIFGVRSAE